MKNLILIISALLIVFNTLIGLTITNYITISFLLVDLSIALSASIIYFTVFSKIANRAERLSYFSVIPHWLS